MFPKEYVGRTIAIHSWTDQIAEAIPEARLDMVMTNFCDNIPRELGKMLSAGSAK
jgi:hypothetical protein